MPAASVARQQGLPLPRHILSAAGDKRLVAQLRAGNQAAFEAIYDRYHRPLLGYCRHLVGSPSDAEDALQQVFASAHRSLTDGERDVELRPWLYTITRNTCISHLRARRQSAGEPDFRTASCEHEAEQRAEVRILVDDMAALPEDQRSALVLAEVGGLAHEEIAAVLGCERPKVKSLVHQARQRLLDRRKARDTSCADVREQLSVLRGGSMRRAWLQLHLASCPNCREYRHEVRRQGALLALTIPIPSAGLRDSVLAAAGGGGGAGGGGALMGAASAGAGGGAPAGAAAGAGGLLPPLASSAVTKAAIGLAVAGGVSGGGLMAAQGPRDSDRGPAHGAQSAETRVTSDAGSGDPSPVSDDAPGSETTETTTEEAAAAEPSSTTDEEGPPEPVEGDEPKQPREPADQAERSESAREKGDEESRAEPEGSSHVPDGTRRSNAKPTKRAEPERSGSHGVEVNVRSPDPVRATKEPKRNPVGPAPDGVLPDNTTGGG